MSVDQENSAPSSTEPRVVVDTTRWTPGTRRIASSSGRVTAGTICAAGSSAASAMTLTRGNVTAGKMAEGRRVPLRTPAAQSTAITMNSAAGRLRTQRGTLTIARAPSRPERDPGAVGKPDLARDHDGIGGR